MRLLAVLFLLSGCFGGHFGQRSIGGSSFGYTTAPCAGQTRPMSMTYLDWQQYCSSQATPFSSSRSVSYKLAMNWGATSATVGDEGHTGASTEGYLSLLVGHNSIGYSGRVGMIADFGGDWSFAGLGAMAFVHYQASDTVQLYGGPGFYGLGIGKLKWDATMSGEGPSRDASALRLLAGAQIQLASFYLLQLELSYLYSPGDGPTMPGYRALGILASPQWAF